jgi:hypothetical protein
MTAYQLASDGPLTAVRAAFGPLQLTQRKTYMMTAERENRARFRALSKPRRLPDGSLDSGSVTLLEACCKIFDNGTERSVLCFGGPWRALLEIGVPVRADVKGSPL